MEQDWAKLASYNSGFEADIVRGILEGADILVQMRGMQVGIYGQSYQGPVIGGVHIYVPSTELELARELVTPAE